MIKFWAGLLFGIFICGICASSAYIYIQKNKLIKENNSNYNLNDISKSGTKPLLKFSFPELAKVEFESTPIEILDLIEQGDGWQSYKIVYTWEGRKISGQMTKPNSEKFGGKRPVIVMVRGWIDPSEYVTGMGTKNAAKVFASKGFVTVATDFLGYGSSDKPENDIWWERFSKPSQVLQLIKSLETLPEVDMDKIGIWGHSNGGQIALSVLEITGGKYPTSLWAPVSVSFPYGVLVFTEGTDNDGQELRRNLAAFEWDYDARTYSISSYLDRIKAPIILHQGSADPDVPQWWSDSLAKKLKSLDAEITYHIYPGADHNLQPAWQTVVNRDVEFYSARLNVKVEQ